MNIVVLGATGPTGRELIRTALVSGHQVTAFVRDPARLTISDPNLTVVTGDATDTSDLSRAFAHADAVLSALGSGKDRSSDIASRAAAAIIAAAHNSGTTRVIIMSAFGVGDTLGNAGPFQRFLIKAMMKNVFADKAKADALVRASDLDWTLVYPVTLSNGPATGHVTADTTPTVTMKSRISRADVAAFMVAQLDDTTWSRKTAIIQA